MFLFYEEEMIEMLYKLRSDLDNFKYIEILMFVWPCMVKLGKEMV
jgi:hypothetical protein